MLVRLVALVAVAYKLSSGGRFTVRGVVAFALAAAGVLAAVDGFLLGVKEDGRARYGHVRSGVVIEKLSSTAADGSRRIGPRGGRDQRRTMPVVTGNGFAFYDTLARAIVSGSPQAWVVDYRFPCANGRTCQGRDFVTAEQWSSLHAGETVNVRQADWETVSSRLDDNPQWSIALADFAIGGVLLVGAGLVSNRLVLFRRRRWLTAPAVVTAVEPVQYGDDVRWRIRFAYFDRDGVPQESADQVVPGKWKSGDSCFAVYRPEKPDLATLQPASE
jgi:uncharacterized protein DUF3592